MSWTSLDYKKWLLHGLLLLSTAGCKNTGSTIEGWVNDTLGRSTISVSTLNLTLTEGNSVGILIVLDKPIAQDATLAYTINAPSSKFQSISGSVQFLKGDQSKLLQIDSILDPAYTGHAQYDVVLSGSMTSFANDLTIQLTLLDAQAPPIISIADESIVEGTGAGTTNLVFTVTASSSSTSAISFDYATSDQTATAGSDYTATSGTATIPAGQTSTTISVPITRDSTEEADETLTVTLSGGSGYSPVSSDLVATGTITNDDIEPTVSIAPVTLSEGNSGTSQLSFTVTLASAASENVVLNYQTTAETGATGATSPSDFTSASGTLTILAGQTTGQIDVTVVGDDLYENDETFTLTLSGGSGYRATGSTLTAVGTIANDDPVPVISVADVEMDEGNSGATNMTFTVSVTGLSSFPIVVAYATSNGTATAGTDYTATSGTLTIAAGQSSGTIQVPILGNTTSEPAETLTLTLSAGSGFDPSGSTLVATGTIKNDDASEMTFTLNDPSAYTFDATFIDFTAGLAPKLQTVGRQTASQMSSGTHSATTVNGGVLTLTQTSATVPSLKDILPAYSSSTNLLGYWRLENDGTDASGNSRTATFYKNPSTYNPYTTSAHVGSYSVLMNGSTCASVANTNGALNLKTSTRLAWINLSATPPSGGMYRIMSQQPGAPYHIMSIDGDLRLRSYDSVAFNSGPNEAKVTIGNWHLVAMVRTEDSSAFKTTIKFYIDGVYRGMVERNSIENLQPAANLMFGCYQTNSTDGFKGYIDELAIWNVALTESEISAIYNAQKGKFEGNFKSPVIDLGIAGSWTIFKPTTTLPFGKELPTTNEAQTSYSSLSASQGLMDSIYALWHFEETSGTTLANSATPGLPATAANSPTLGAAGQFGKSISLSRSSSQCLTTASATLGNEFTISLWTKVLSSSSTAHTLVANTAQASTSNGFKLFVNTWNTSDGAVIFQTGNGGTGTRSAKTSTNPVGPGRWNHIAVVVNRSSGTANIYVNGVISNAGTSENLARIDFATTGTLALGCMTDSTGYLDGQLDETAIWNRSLSASEILQLYRRGANRIMYQVRSCASNPCNETTETWAGPDGTSSTYFSELFNYSTVSSGTPSGSVNASALEVTFSAFPSIASRVATNRYFQYRVFMESDDKSSNCSGAPCMPELSEVQVGPIGRYYGGSPSLTLNTATTVSKLHEIAVSDLTAGCTTYQLSTDDGTTWNYWTGSAWAATTSGAAHSNAVSQLTEARLLMLSGGPFKFKAFLSTNTSGDMLNSCQLNTLDLRYDP